jgi:hypothetical protein
MDIGKSDARVIAIDVYHITPLNSLDQYQYFVTIVATDCWVDFRPLKKRQFTSE